MTKIVITRFSALGDVAMLAAFLPELIVQYPDIQLLIVSRPKFKQLFSKIPNITFMGVDLESEYKSVFSLRRLAKEIKQENPTHFADCHNVIRTQILQKLLRIKKTKALDKGRNEKKKMTQKTKKIMTPISSMHQRYQEVFAALGFPFELQNQLPNLNVEKSGIGIAPFAFYREKTWDLEKSQQLALRLAEKGEEVFLFGGNELEKEILMEWEEMHENISSIAGKFDFSEELKIMSRLKTMVSMDSANMHLASLAGTRVVSIWGSTHPHLGFLGYGQQLSDCVFNEISCRPCSVYGNVPCFKKDLQCLRDISVAEVLNKILE